MKHVDIEKIVIRNIVPNYLVSEIEFVKTDMANKIARKLVTEGFVEFSTCKNEYTPIEGVTEMEARICVVKPMQE